jgi:ArsR family transcriptional regulator
MTVSATSASTSRASALPLPTSLFSAFADETRLRILNLLAAGELCVCDLCEVLEETQPKVSRHLATLRRVGLVEVRREGKWKYYSIASSEEAPSPLHGVLLGCVQSCLSELDELSRDRERLRALSPELRCG